MRMGAGQMLTILVNLSVLAGIGLLSYELNQSRRIALTEMAQSVVATRIEVGNAIAANADVWVKGNVGQPLDPSEAAIFRRQVTNLTAEAYWNVQMSQQLGLDVAASTEHAEFALYLHRNPGALAVWLERNEDNSRYRKLLDPEAAFASEFRDRVMSAIESFRSHENSGSGA